MLCTACSQVAGLSLLCHVHFNCGFAVFMCVCLHPNSYPNIPMYMLEYCAIAHQLRMQRLHYTVLVLPSPSRFTLMQNSSVVSTQLLGASSSVTSTGIAEKLACKLSHAAQFFVSCTLTDPLMLPPVESWLIQHFQQLYKD